ncbi:class B sortase [Inconstantimicrobium porci]|uniref:class B sortase n=1 Tax=Inconstantimicrobium porci TaxID=2652291 RepID=UPI002409C9B5|nr:class B sortase [Inconstantimicrobium porci]MDD6771100.1 class B sortase [Inconstantimicrobium porci]
MKRKVLSIIELALVIIIVFSSYKVFSKMYRYKKDEKTYNDITKEYKVDKIGNIDKAADKSKSSKAANQAEYKSLYDKLNIRNTDYRFWLRVENTNINYPVVQASDNKYYLKHDINKAASISGCPFVNCDNNVKTDKNVIVYGHNMRRNNMFNQLERFKESQFFNGDNNIVITDKEGDHIYKVFSVYTMKSNDELGKTNYSNKDEFFEAVKAMQSKSFYYKDIKVADNDRILTLVTCTYEINDGRLVVEAKSVS